MNYDALVILIVATFSAAFAGSLLGIWLGMRIAITAVKASFQIADEVHTKPPRTP